MAKIKEVKEDEVILTDGTIIKQPGENMEDMYYSALSDKFNYGKTKNDSWLSSFIDQSLDSLKKSVKQKPDLAFQATREMNRMAKGLQEYYDRKRANDSDYSKYLLRDALHPIQRQFYDSKSKKITYLAGRRHGKSRGIVSKALKHCLENPPEINGVKRVHQAMIMGLTVEKTANLYWDVLKSEIKAAHINGIRIDNASYKITFPNGNFLFLYGNNSKAEREKLRGFDLSFVAIDETQSQVALLYLIESIIQPQLKGTDGELVLAGTAPLSAGTYWEKCITGDQYEHIHGTMADNPYIKDGVQALQDVLTENHWTTDNITYRREYLAEIAYDTNRMVYSSRTYYDTIPDDFHPTSCYIGLDFGWQDYSSFAPILFDDHGEGYLIDEYKERKIASSMLVEVANTLVNKIHKQYNIPMEDIHIVADSSHQQVSADIYNRGVYTIQNAYKLDEAYQINRVAEGLQVGYLHIKKGGYFDQECDQFVWKYDEEKGCVVYQIDEDVFHPDISDSVKYAYNTYLSDKGVQ